jgi:hypothetical protein
MLEAWLLNYAVRGRASADQLGELRQLVERMSDRQKEALLVWLEARGALHPRVSAPRRRSSAVGARLGVRGFGLPSQPRLPLETRPGA